jgi:F0F1-type ATP synthase membrane subunit b/b'
MLKQLAEALEKLERAASDNERRAAQIREQARREAAEMAEAAAQKAGVSADGIAALRAAILQELSA